MTKKIESMPDLIALLKLALSDRTERVSAIKVFQKCIFDARAQAHGATAEHWEILNDLAVDLDYYEPNPDDQREDPSYYGDQRLEAEIKEALQKLGVLPPCVDHT